MWQAGRICGRLWSSVVASEQARTASPAQQLAWHLRQRALRHYSEGLAELDATHDLDAYVVEVLTGNVSAMVQATRNRLPPVVPPLRLRPPSLPVAWCARRRCAALAPRHRPGCSS
jgi:hypothetical protein